VEGGRAPETRRGDQRTKAKHSKAKTTETGQDDTSGKYDETYVKGRGEGKRIGFANSWCEKNRRGWVVNVQEKKPRKKVSKPNSGPARRGEGENWGKENLSPKRRTLTKGSSF